MGKDGGRDLVEKGRTGGWDRIEIIGIKLCEWFAWIFIAFFVSFIIYAIVKGMIWGAI